MNNKTLFALKVAVSLTLAYLIPFALGWPQASTAATTVMLIACTGGQRESLEKGTLRVLGTIVGAVIGLLLVGLFAQDRLLYMFCVSIVVALIFYLRNAYQKDPTLFMLTGVMTLMMSNGGDANGAFLYGVDRAHMTIFGVVIYTLVGTYLFPYKVEQNLQALTQDVLQAQRQLFTSVITLLREHNQAHRTNETAVHTLENKGINDNELDGDTADLAAVKKKIDVQVTALFNAQNILEQRFSSASKESSDVAAYLTEWQLTLHYTKKITQLLITVSHGYFHHGNTQALLKDYDSFVETIDSLFQRCQDVWGETGATYRATETQIQLNEKQLDAAAHLDKATTLTLVYAMNQLQRQLSRLAETISCIDSITKRVSFKERLQPAPSTFVWWDCENFKTAIKVFITYWLSSVIWIFFNPPGGYSFVIFSTIFMSLLSFMPVHPKLLAVLFTFGFIFSVPAYVFVLPQLELGIELALFLFIYTFIGFYLFKGPITIFFMLGLFTLGINNTMTYHFGIIMTIMMLFYLVVMMIVFSHYFPFSSKAEHLFLTVRERLFRHQLQLVTRLQSPSPSWLDRLAIPLHAKTMNISAKKQALWASKIDVSYFSKNTTSSLIGYTKACQTLVDHTNNLLLAQAALKNNPLIAKLRTESQDTVIPRLIQLHANHADTPYEHSQERARVFSSLNDEYDKAESAIESFFQSLNLDDYSQNDIARFYIFLNLKRNIFETLIQVDHASQALAFDNLKQHRF
ncbi:FUSC family protein [Vibrio sp. ZSDZ65]|uniref:FUSC family protein n=1 Tax=Vibrio qingdaonensis TaxID=2829491 RepID=A0A9X3HV32_9VIBR|nr:FUSC family protein [Vibrio qingdaonensis]MCW8345110.1 FUSC family protein [Vibrio qingdaonensis]